MPASPAPVAGRLRAIAAALAVSTAWPAAAGDAAGHLTFESVLDGRCQILSAGGKLRVLRNTHGERPIKFRLTRLFIGIPQGLSVGVAPPAGEDVKLGCTRVDGKPQDWRVERAEFSEMEPER